MTNIATGKAEQKRKERAPGLHFYTFSKPQDALFSEGKGQKTGGQTAMTDTLEFALQKKMKLTLSDKKEEKKK